MFCFHVKAYRTNYDAIPIYKLTYRCISDIAFSMIILSIDRLVFLFYFKSDSNFNIHIICQFFFYFKKVYRSLIKYCLHFLL